MKITTWVNINNTAVSDQAKSLRLDLVSPGRGLITVLADEPPEKGQYTKVAMQLGDNQVQIVFQGFIDQVTHIQTRQYRVLVREFSALLNQRIAINIQHATPADILAEISEQTGLVFVLPDSEWTKNDVARFQHIGGGYGALDYLLRTFNVKSPVWHQQPDGRIYVGELKKSLMAGKELTIKPELFSSISATAGTLPAIPRLRPGAKINHGTGTKYITAVEINDNLMRLTWADKISNKHLQAIQ